MDGIARRFRNQEMRQIRRWFAQRRDLQALISIHMQRWKAVIIDWGGKSEERGEENQAAAGGRAAVWKAPKQPRKRYLQRPRKEVTAFR